METETSVDLNFLNDMLFNRDINGYVLGLTKWHYFWDLRNCLLTSIENMI